MYSIVASVCFLVNHWLYQILNIVEHTQQNVPPQFVAELQLEDQVRFGVPR